MVFSQCQRVFIIICSGVRKMVSYSKVGTFENYDTGWLRNAAGNAAYAPYIVKNSVESIKLLVFQRDEILCQVLTVTPQETTKKSPCFATPKSGWPAKVPWSTSPIPKRGPRRCM